MILLSTPTRRCKSRWEYSRKGLVSIPFLASRAWSQGKAVELGRIVLLLLRNDKRRGGRACG
jgi:hypothetical protein